MSELLGITSEQPYNANSLLTEELQKKLENLKKYIDGLGLLAVGFSGGVDSSLLTAIAHEVLGDRLIAVTGADASVPKRELKEAMAFCIWNNRSTIETVQ